MTCGQHVDRSVYMCTSVHYRPTSIPLKIPDQEKLVGILACWLPGPLVSQARHFSCLGVWPEAWRGKTVWCLCAIACCNVESWVRKW